MARARNIKPGFFRNADLVELPMEARLLFIGLWTLADREGRLEDRPKQIKMEIFPADNVDVDALLNDIAATGMLARYTHDGKRCLQVVNFAKHQNPHRDEKPSTLPDLHGHGVANEHAQGQHSASTVQAQCTPDAGTVAIGLNPESCSLNPDHLIPETLTTHGIGTPTGVTPSQAVAACVVIKAAGIASVNSSHPDLAALIDAGAGVGQFAEAAQMAAKKRKGFAYVLGIVRGQLADAQALADSVPAGGGLPGAGKTQPESFRQRDDRIARERWEQMTGQTHPDNLPKTPVNVIDITPAKSLALKVCQ